MKNWNERTTPMVEKNTLQKTQIRSVFFTEKFWPPDLDWSFFQAFPFGQHIQRQQQSPEDMPDKMPEDMPDRLSDTMSDISDRVPEYMPDIMPTTSSKKGGPWWPWLKVAQVTMCRQGVMCRQGAMRRQGVVTMRRQGVMRRQGAMRRQGMCRHNASSGGSGSSPMCRHNTSSASAPNVRPKLRVPCIYIYIYKKTIITYIYIN